MRSNPETDARLREKLREAVQKLADGSADSSTIGWRKIHYRCPSCGPFVITIDAEPWISTMSELLRSKIIEMVLDAGDGMVMIYCPRNDGPTDVTAEVLPPGVAMSP